MPPAPTRAVHETVTPPGATGRCEMVEEDLTPHDAWDAGELGCGELVILLAGRLNALAPGQRLLLTATDIGAPHDLPAFCRLTGHLLLLANPPRYLIQRKD